MNEIGSKLPLFESHNKKAIQETEECRSIQASVRIVILETSTYQVSYPKSNDKHLN